MSLLRFLRPRGLFVKQVVSFFFAFIAVWFVAGMIDVWMASARFERDARGLLDRADFAALAAPAGRVDLADPVACRRLADTVLWALADQGVREVSDFVDLVAYFKDGRLNVSVLDRGRIACATAPSPLPLLQRALQAELAAGAARGNAVLHGEDQWAMTRRVSLGGGREALVGINYWPGWATDTDYVVPYDLMRTFLYALGIGTTFVALWMWLLLRRVRRATQAADRWAEGDFSVRIADRSRDELSALAERFNRMADALGRTLHLEKALGGSLERNRIARDLHDTAKQRSFVLGLKLAELEHDAGGDERLLRTIAQARALADRLQQDLVDAVSGFNAPAIAELGLREALTRNIDDLLGGSGIAWSLDLPVELEERLRAHPARAQELLMIAHEAVANARRHSGCRRVRVAGERHGGRWLWSVEDDGRGFDPAAAPLGMGLANLRWRADQLPHGQLKIVASGAGTRVRAEFDADAPA
ncbi:HAMP domain-containing protein [Lysobacter sp. K5869]|uniref:HAMP domain-containing sensor histidine kinase n=1 Tax=Lysobacter sp. K5869 TaxID=2820808 RepID=UPI001C0622A3|nr:HAMP domain-containing protein [Lysobacter sp. K5869]QWP77971.1 HAMP domain-containing protein [Lysobacter sp. K5869]